MPDSTREAVADGKIVAIRYTLRDADGEILDRSEEGVPFEYLHGAGNIVAGLERVLAGRQPGEQVIVEVAPEDGYGAYDPEGAQVVERRAFPAGLDIQVGMQFTAEDPEGRTVDVWVSDVSGDAITVDTNHPLAGETLHFEVTILGVRDATLEERLHGHIHGSAGGGH